MPPGFVEPKDARAQRRFYGCAFRWCVHASEVNGNKCMLVARCVKLRAWIQCDEVSVSARTSRSMQKWELLPTLCEVNDRLSDQVASLSVVKHLVQPCARVCGIHLGNKWQTTRPVLRETWFICFFILLCMCVGMDISRANHISCHVSGAMTTP